MEEYLNAGAKKARQLGAPEFFPANGTANQVETKLTLQEFRPIEIPTVSAEDYTKTREAVEATGAFIASIRSVSIEDLLKEDGNRRKRRFNHNGISFSETMRATFPPAMEVFINPKAVRIKSSNNLPADKQKIKIAEAEVRLKDQLPEEVRDFVSLHMVDPSTYSQIEDAWMDAGHGVLFRGFFARTDIKTFMNLVAHVGRDDPTGRRRVGDWDRGFGFSVGFAVPVGVLPRKLTV